ncbi:unnamed protein product, partial [Polarella glacialis]
LVQRNTKIDLQVQRLDENAERQAQKLDEHGERLETHGGKLDELGVSVTDLKVDSKSYELTLAHHEKRLVELADGVKQALDHVIDDEQNAQIKALELALKDQSHQLQTLQSEASR